MKTESILIKKQEHEISIDFNGIEADLIIKTRYDDRYNSGYNSFSITGEIHTAGKRRDSSLLVAGAIHDEIAKHAPQFAKYIKWHGMTSDGLMGYIHHTISLAGDKDCYGLRKGEKKEFKRDGVPLWKLAPVDAEGNEAALRLEPCVESETKPEDSVRFGYVPLYTVGKGKEPNLEGAREAAFWPDWRLCDSCNNN